VEAVVGCKKVIFNTSGVRGMVATKEEVAIPANVEGSGEPQMEVVAVGHASKRDEPGLDRLAVRQGCGGLLHFPPQHPGDDLLGEGIST
jgi:hypothetical protein